MSDKRKRAKARGDGFDGSHITPLEKLQRHKQVLLNPFAKIGNVNFSSWINEGLPETLWAVLIVDAIERTRALEIFRSVLDRFHEQREKVSLGVLAHSFLATLDADTFKAIFEEICRDPDVVRALRPLRQIKTLPDAALWETLLPAGDPQEDFKALAKAIFTSYDHQSQSATDCRWLRIMCLFATDRIRVMEGLEDGMKDIIEYPNRGEMQKVRPQIRAMEMMTRGPEMGSKIDPSWCENFWQECFEVSGCMPVHFDEEPSFDRKAALNNIASVYDDLLGHFMATSKTTSIDARHDAAFGLVFYSLQLTAFVLREGIDQTTQGRLALRVALEGFITLKYLAKHDDEKLWMQYRNYGSGQTKLALLKNLRDESLPSFIDLHELEFLANEDAWLEFQDINLGVWADKNLRKMAEEAGAKDIYDKYYDVLSGYVHGSWSAVRDAVFAVCANPLHRFHRIPMPPRLRMRSVAGDLFKIGNQALDQLASLYSPFKVRLKFPEKEHEQTEASPDMAAGKGVEENE